MTTNPVIATWGPPPWAQSHEHDEEAVIYSRKIGTVAEVDGEELTVEIVQRDEINVATDQSVITRSPAFVRVSCLRVGPREAHELEQLLNSAKNMIEGGQM